jgi:hypothetical protein
VLKMVVKKGILTGVCWGRYGLWALEYGVNSLGLGYLRWGCFWLFGYLVDSGLLEILVSGLVLILLFRLVALFLVFIILLVV